MSTRITQVIETLEAEKADLQARLEWLDQQIESFRAHAEQAPAIPASPTPAAAPVATAAPKRAKRLEKDSRARKRRAAVKPLKRDLVPEILAQLKKQPNSTAGQLAAALDVNRNTVNSKLLTLRKAGTIVKADRGYALAEKSAT